MLLDHDTGLHVQALVLQTSLKCMQFPTLSAVVFCLMITLCAHTLQRGVRLSVSWTHIVDCVSTVCLKRATQPKTLVKQNNCASCFIALNLLYLLKTLTQEVSQDPDTACCHKTLTQDTVTGLCDDSIWSW